MNTWNDGKTRWNGGARWGAAPSPRKPTTMSIIAINVSKLPIPRKLVKGQEVISMSTDNPKVPGNAALVTTFGVAQVALTAANAAYEEAHQTLKNLKAVRDDALGTWNIGLNSLAAFTESATGGDPTQILSTGFDVKAPPSPPSPVTQVQNVKVYFTGNPGYSEVRWKRVTNADSYIVECSPDPITNTSWAYKDTVSEIQFTGNGAVPGEKCWYRVAALNKAGRGPWSEPALRPVM